MYVRKLRTCRGGRIWPLKHRSLVHLMVALYTARSKSLRQCIYVVENIRSVVENRKVGLACKFYWCPIQWNYVGQIRSNLGEGRNELQHVYSTLKWLRSIGTILWGLTTSYLCPSSYQHDFECLLLLPTFVLCFGISLTYAPYFFKSPLWKVLSTP